LFTPIQGGLDRSQQFRGVERFVQKSNGASVEGALSNFIILVGRNKDDRQLRTLESERGAAIRFRPFLASVRL
jgi:hypothetical protein